MKSTGIVRKLDQLGRIVIPIEIRKTLGLDNEPIEIFIDDEIIALRKYEPSCVFCKNVTDIFDYKGKHICEDCLKELSLNANK